MADVTHKAGFIAILVAIATASFFLIQILIPAPSSRVSDAQAVGTFATYNFGKASAAGDNKMLRGGGWLDETPGCRWTGGRAELTLADTFAANQNLLFRVKAEGLVSDKRPAQKVNVIVNGSLLGTLKFDNKAAAASQEFSLSPKLFNARNDGVRVAFIEARPTSRASAGLGSDTTVRSICLKRISLLLDQS